MEDRERTLIILLSMHRCGSSLTTRVLERLGMSLGPFELIGAEPTNPYGHFEALPFVLLNRRIQSLVFGFTDDLPESPDVLERFGETKGRWAPDTYVPEEFLAEGRSLIRTLIDSGQVSGFKDPRTVLTWPFWERVLASFPDLRVMPLGLIRSPHEIAMSLVNRRGGWRGYWPSLDVIAVHFRRQQEILESRPDRIPALCFGSPSYLKTLETAIRQAGLSWDATAVLELFDSSAVHQLPAAVAHQAQQLFESMCGEATNPCDGDINRDRLEKDARFLERLRLDQWKTKEQEISHAWEEAKKNGSRAGALENELSEARNRLDEIQHRLDEIQHRLDDAHHRLDDAQDERQRLQSQLIETEQKLIRAQESEIQAWHRADSLRGRLDRFEKHPLLGTALRGRRRLRRLIHSVGEGISNATNGSR
jgi:hypothetical protein